MTPDNNDLDDLRRELEFRREVDETAAELAERYRNERWEPLWDDLEELMGRWLRGIGYSTRALVYLTLLALVWVLDYALFDPKDLTERPLGSLTLGELLNNFWWVLIGGGGSIMLVRAFFAEEDGGWEWGVDWEGWGKAGLWLLAVGAVAVRADLRAVAMRRAILTAV